MSTEKRTAANRVNATKSTGPKSATGRAKAAKNALAHGLCSAAPIVIGEDPAEWEAHRSGILEALAPVRGLEAALAERVASSLWRLRRIVSYETAVSLASVEEAIDATSAPRPAPSPFQTDSDPHEEAETELAEAEYEVEWGADTEKLFDQLGSLPDNAPVDGGAVDGLLTALNSALPNPDANYCDFEDTKVLMSLGVPKAHLGDAFAWDGWTAGHVRQALALLAAKFGVESEKLFTRAAAEFREGQAESVAKLSEAKKRVADLRRRRDAKAKRTVIRRSLPDGDMLDRIARYEAHLSRQMLQSLNTLERLQAARAGKDVPPPAAGTLIVDQPLALPSQDAA